MVRLVMADCAAGGLGESTSRFEVRGGFVRRIATPRGDVRTYDRRGGPTAASRVIIRRCRGAAHLPGLLPTRPPLPE